MSYISKSLPRLAIAGAVALIAALITLPGSPAEARGGLRARVFLTQAKIPGRTTERGLIGFARHHLARTLHETQDPKLTDRKWIANLVTSFNSSPNDLEFSIVFNDVEKHGKFVDSMSIFTANRNERTFVSKVKLDRPKFEPNHKYDLVVVVHRVEAGHFRFETRGQAKQNTGVVNFSDSET